MNTKRLDMLIDELRTNFDMVAEARATLVDMTQYKFVADVVLNELERCVERRAKLMQDVRPYGIYTHEQALSAIFLLEEREKQAARQIGGGIA